VGGRLSLRQLGSCADFDDVQQQCKNTGCELQSKIFCVKCNVHLCLKKGAVSLHSILISLGLAAAYVCICDFFVYLDDIITCCFVTQNVQIITDHINIHDSIITINKLQ